MHGIEKSGTSSRSFTVTARSRASSIGSSGSPSYVVTVCTMSTVTAQAYVRWRSRASAGRIARTSPSVSASTGLPTRTPAPRASVPNCTLCRTRRAGLEMRMVEFSSRIDGRSVLRKWL